jgi:hypothetical protein
VQWLYTQPELRQEIERLRNHQTATGQAIHTAERTSRASLQQRLELLLKVNRRLRVEIKELKAALALAHGERRAAGPPR